MAEIRQAKSRDNADRFQHYVPCAYLQFFSPVDPKERRDTRKLPVWIYDGEKSRLCPVESICAIECLYSRADPKGAEKFIREKLEGPYADVIRDLLRHGQLSKGDLQFLLYFAFQLHARSPKFHLKVTEERIETITEIAGSITHTIEPILPDDCWRPHHYLGRLCSHYEIRIFPTTEELFTSDDPTLIFDDPDAGTLAVVILLPLTPNYLFVAVRNDRFWIDGQPIAEDCKRVNLYEVVNRYKFIITKRGVPPGVRIALGHREKTSRRVVVEKKVHHDPMSFGWDFTFIKDNPIFVRPKPVRPVRMWISRLCSIIAHRATISQ